MQLYDGFKIKFYEIKLFWVGLLLSLSTKNVINQGGKLCSLKLTYFSNDSVHCNNSPET